MPVCPAVLILKQCYFYEEKQMHFVNAKAILTGSLADKNGMNVYK
jgi:hypothetical protein